MVQDNERKLEVLESKLIDTQAGKVSEKYKMVSWTNISGMRPQQTHVGGTEVVCTPNWGVL